MTSDKAGKVKQILDRGYTTPSVQNICGKDEYALTNGFKIVIVDKEIYDYVKGLEDGT